MSILSNLPDFEEEELLINSAKSSDSGMEVLLDKYKTLVHVNAHKWKKYTAMPVQDLYQEGLIGLMKAARRFDPAYKTKFTSWAICCIEGAIRSSIKKERRHEANISLSTLLSGTDIDHEGIFAAAPTEFNNEETLSEVSLQLDLSSIVTKRELDLIKVRYNIRI